MGKIDEEYTFSILSYIHSLQHEQENKIIIQKLHSQNNILKNDLIHYISNNTKQREQIKSLQNLQHDAISTIQTMEQTQTDAEASITKLQLNEEMYKRKLNK